MKTKIIYISGSEIFDINDIRAAFEEVRGALNLDKTTVLFGVPVDSEDAGFAAQTPKDIIEKAEPLETTEPEMETKKVVEDVVETVKNDEQNESVVDVPLKKRGRPRKEDKVEITQESEIEPIIDAIPEEIAEEDETPSEDTVVPILSVLSVEENEDATEEPAKDLETLPDIIDENNEEVMSVEITATATTDEEDNEADLEKLLSAMTPLQEDTAEEKATEDMVHDTENDSVDDSFDATLEQLATEFVENQDKIAAESKSNSRSKISKLRSILPFKQSKHKDQGLGDLFGWAGIAANDEEFSVPGFFTSAAGKK